MVEVKIISKMLTPNPYSRPQDTVNKVKGIVVHWTASPQGRNKGVWNYFEKRKNGEGGYGSAHFIVDLDGTIWNCIPTNEMAYHVGSSTYTTEAKNKLGSYPNNCTVGIEFCITDDHGRMNKSTWNEGAKLVAYLLEKFNLTTNDIWLHQEVVGWKDCHRYFVENPNEYDRFKNDVSNFIQGNVTENPDNSSPNGAFYIVKSGDTLWDIANAHNLSVEKLEELNSDQDLNPLKVGTTLRVSEMVTEKYEIQKGDTLWGISRKFNTTVADLKKLNPNVDSLGLRVGDYLQIPITVKESLPTNYDDVLSNVILKYGDHGEDVKKLQNALNKLNYNVGYADGIFGLATKDALLRYQSMHYGLDIDGVFGNATREHMLNQLLK
jgi:N-acetylmuramoyl-L-alanine amidase CwlA